MKLIKLSEEHYIIVDDSEIKEGDWMYNSDREPSMLQCIGKGSLRGWQKITHSTNIDWNEVYYIPLSEVKELIGEVHSFEKLKDIALDKSCSPSDWEWIYGYMLLGYNQALEDNKDRKYTERDLWRAFDSGKAGKMALEFYETLFQPQTEWEVEFVDGKLKLKQ